MWLPIRAEVCFHRIRKAGETVTLNIPLGNPFCLTSATGVTMDVTGGGSANYGDIAAGASVTRSISFTIPEETACGTQLAIELTINSSLGPVVRTFTLQIGTPTGILPAVNYSSGNLAVPIPDVSTVERFRLRSPIAEPLAMSMLRSALTIRSMATWQ